MITSRTPFRVSFIGGGSDLPPFYLSNDFGFVISAAIRRYMYVNIHPRFEQSHRIAYSSIEETEDTESIKHDLVRESIKMSKTLEFIEVTTIADIPSGTGIGSSSALTVGLLNALYTYNKEALPQKFLAEKACEVEIDILNKPIGKQDQYASAFGGLSEIEFREEGVSIKPVFNSEWVNVLESWVLLFYIGQSRNANEILKHHGKATHDTNLKIRDLALEAAQVMATSLDIQKFAGLVGQSWELKRNLPYVSMSIADEWYTKAKENGALGGKMLGAGGGGFLMLLAPPSSHGNIKAAIGYPRELPFKIDPVGTTIVHNDG